MAWQSHNQHECATALVNTIIGFVFRNTCFHNEYFLIFLVVVNNNWLWATTVNGSVVMGNTQPVTTLISKYRHIIVKLPTTRVEDWRINLHLCPPMINVGSFEAWTIKEHVFNFQQPSTCLLLGEDIGNSHIVGKYVQI
jgi:hypothetical protein